MNVNKFISLLNRLDDYIDNMSSKRSRSTQQYISNLNKKLEDVVTSEIDSTHDQIQGMSISDITPREITPDPENIHVVSFSAKFDEQDPEEIKA